jgi:hypothetical protein
MNEWWLIIHAPGGPWCWPLGGDQSERDRLVAAGRVLAGFPADEAWVDDDSKLAVMVSLGEPHPTLIARATVGTLADLRKVDQALVDAHQAGRAQWSHTRQVEALALMLATMDSDTLATALADPAIAAKVAAVSAGEGKTP